MRDLYEGTRSCSDSSHLTRNTCLSVGTCGAESGAGAGGNYENNETACVEAFDCGDNFQTKCVWTPSNTWQYVGYEGQFKVTYDNYDSGCMPWRHNNIKFYVEQAISSIPSIQRVELVESYSEDIGNMHIIKFVIQFRSPTTGLQPFDVPFDETLGIEVPFDGCEQAICQHGVNCTNISVIVNRRHGLGYYSQGQHFQLSFSTSSENCPLCSRYVTSTSLPIDWAEIDMSADTSLQGRLNALYNIANSSYDNGTLGVIVTRHSVPNSEGFVFSITFRGNSVDGDVPSLMLAFPSTLGAQNTTDDLGAEKVALATVQNGMMGDLEFCTTRNERHV